MKHHTAEKIFELGQEIIQWAENSELTREAEHRFVEAVTFSDADVIVSALERLLGTHFIEFPVWARNLAFRLAILQKPKDAALLRRAAADLRCFGPDWDTEADLLEQRANIIEQI